MPDSKAVVELLNLKPIERFALTTRSDLQTENQRRKAFATYVALREKICEDYLPTINSAIPFINDHSRTHLQRVLVHIEAIISRHFVDANQPAGEIPRERVLGWADTLILLNALVWHDMGNIYGREGHAKRVKECFGAVAGTLYDDDLQDHIRRVAEAHSGKGAIEKVIPDDDACLSYRGETINLQFLAAVLRFADELDEDQRRIVQQEWRTLEKDGEPLVPRASHRFWYFCEKNKKLGVEHSTGEIDTHLVVKIESHIPLEEFAQEFVFKSANDGKPEIKIRAMSEYFRRVFKIDDERRYCNNFLTKAYYHRGVKGIDVSVRYEEAKYHKFSFGGTVTPESLLKNDSLQDLHSYIEEALEFRAKDC